MTTTTTAVTQSVNVYTSRRKRSRSQFDAENIDATAVSTADSEQHPRKKPRIASSLGAITSLAPSLLKSPRKRAFSETPLSSNDEHTRILKESSPNKKIRTNSHPQPRNTTGMMVDEEERELRGEHTTRDISIEHKAVDIAMDDEGDVPMERTKIETEVAHAATTNQPIKAKPRLTRKVSIGAVDAMTQQRPSKRRSRQQFPPNRVRRSGVEFLVQCGVGA